MAIDSKDYTGVTIGDYEVIKPLGKGGMGVVYQARHRSLDRLVAIKLLPPQFAMDTEFVQRFNREARAAARLNHPHIIQIYDFGKTDETYYFVMEYVTGSSLGDRLRRFGPLQEPGAIAFLRAACAALDAAHRAGIVHRDIKPDNFLITDDGTVKLGDLGLARQVQEESSLTMTGTAMGTPFYISPEQVRCERDIDGRTDVYSLGATMYHVVTGEVPFGGSSAAVIMARHLNDPAPWPKEKNPRLSDGLCHVIAKMMAKDRADRYANVAEIVADLDRLESGNAPLAVAMPPKRSTVVVPSSKNPLSEIPTLIEAPRPTLSEAMTAASTPLSPSSPAHARPTQKLIWMGIGIGATILALVVLGLLLTPKMRLKRQAKLEPGMPPMPTESVSSLPVPEGFRFEQAFKITSDVSISSISPQKNLDSEKMLVVSPKHSALLFIEPTVLMNHLFSKAFEGGRPMLPTPMMSRIVLVARHVETPTKVSLYRVMSAWQPSAVTWMQALPGQPWKAPGAAGEPDRDSQAVASVTVDAANKAYLFEVTPSLRAWREDRMRDGKVEFNGWMLVAEGGGTVMFSSSECPLESDCPQVEIFFATKKYGRGLRDM